MQYNAKVERHPFGGGHVVVRELTAGEFQHIQEQHPDSSGVDCAATLVQMALVEPAYATVEEAKADLLSLPVRGINELVALIQRVAGLEGKG